MSVIIEKAGRQIPLQRGSKITLESQSHEQIKILNQQGHTPKDLIVKRNEKDLVLSSDDEDFEVVLADFFEQTNTEVLLDIPTDAGLTQTAITPQTEVLLASTITDTSSPSFGLISLGVLAGILTVSAVGLGSGGGSGGNNNTVPDNSNNLNNIPDNNKQNNPNDNGQNNNNQDNGDQGGSDSGDNPPAIQNVELQITTNDDGGLTVTGKAEPNTKVEIDVDGDGNPEYTVDTDENGNFNTTVNKEDLPTEKEQLEVTATAKDEEGNEVGEPATEIIDNPAYVNEELTVTLETNIGGEDNIINSEEAEQDQTVEIKVEGLQDGEKPSFKISETELLINPKADSVNVWEVTIPKEKLYTDEGEGKSVTISVTGDKGSEGNVEAPYSVDITAPGKPEFNDPQYNSDDKTLTISGTAEKGATVKVTVGDQNPKEVTADENGKFEVTFENIEQDEQAQNMPVNATATDTAGNTSEKATSSATIPGTNDTPTTDNHAPELILGAEVVSVDENIAGAVITTVQVSDEDEGDNPQLSVSDDRFEITADKGNLHLKLKDNLALDYDQSEREINLTVTADDGKENGKTTKTIKINVQDDISDNVVQDVVITSIKPNDNGGLTILGTAQPGVNLINICLGDNIVYQASNNDSDGSFEGEISADKLPTNEKQVTITVTAKDEDDNDVGASATQTVENPAYVNELSVELENSYIGGEDKVINSEESNQNQKVEIKVTNLQEDEQTVFKIGEKEISGNLKNGSDNVWEVDIPASNLKLQQGENSVAISVTGNKGSTGNDVSAEYSVDTIAPTVEITRAEFDNSENALVIEGITEVGAKVIVTIDGTQYEDTAGQDGKFKLSESSINLEENSRDVSITATATDTAGNTGNEATTTATIPAANNDDPNPTLSNDNVSVTLAEDTGSNKTDGITKNGNLNVTGIDGKDWVYSLDGENWATGSGTEISQSELGGDGVKNVQVSLSQDGENPIDNPASIEFTLDTTPPTPTIETEYNQETRALKVTVTASADEAYCTGNITLSFREGTGPTGFSLNENGVSVQHFTVSEDKTGKDYDVTVTIWDKAGNSATVEQSINIPAANDNPPTPTLSNEGVSVALVEDTGSDTTDKITQNGNLNVTGIDGKDWVYSLDGENWATGSGTEISQSELGGDGVKNVQVSLSQDGENPIDNPASIEFTLDTKVDAPSISSSYNKNTQVLTVSGTAEANSTIELSVVGNTQTVNVGNNGSFSKDFNVARQDTDFIPGIKATITDKAGNIDSSYEQPANVTIPANLNNRGIKLSLVNDSGMGGDGYTNQADFNVSGVDGQQWVYRIDNGAWQVGSSNKITGITGEGQHRVEVSRSEDGTNPIDINTYLPEGFSFTLDTVGASVSDLNATPNGDKVTVSGKTEANLQVTIKVGNITDSATADSNGNFSKVITVTQTENQQNLNVSATPAQDKAGNNGITATGNVTIDALPQTDDKVAKARQAIQDLQTAVTRAEQDGTIEHGEYNDLNALRDAAKAAVQAVGESNSAYQELKDDLNSAANYVRGTTAEQSQQLLSQLNSTRGKNTAAEHVKALNAVRGMNHLDDVTLTSDSSIINEANSAANALSHTANNFNGHANLSSTTDAYSSIVGYMDDYGSAQNLNTAGHRMHLLEPYLNETAVGISRYSNILVFGDNMNWDGDGPFSNYGNKVTVIDKSNTAPQTVEWPAEGYFPYAMMPEGSNNWTFSVLDTSQSNGSNQSTLLNNAIVTVNGQQVAVTHDLYNTGDANKFGVMLFNQYDNIKFTYAFSRPQEGQVNEYNVKVVADGGTWEYTVYVFDDVSAAQNHANTPATVLAPNQSILPPDQDLSGNLNSEAVIYTGTEDNDVVPVAELVATAKVELGSGDDVVEINHYLGGDIDGGDGFDTVVLTGGANALSGNHLNGIEAINLGSTSRDNPNVVSLTADDLINNHDENGNLWISGQVGDRVALFDGVVESDTTIENADGVVFHQYTYTADNTTYAMLISDELYQNGNGVVI